MSGSSRLSLLAMVCSLGLFTLVAGALLGGVHALTAGPIEQASRRAVEQAIADVVPAFDNNPAAEAVEVNVPGCGRPLTLYPALSGGKFAGAAVVSYSLSGFSGEITVMFGFDASGVVTGYRVLTHSETPGLGAKMEEWFRSDVDARSVIGADLEKIRPFVRKDGGDIDGITGATISSRAFLEAMRSAREAFAIYCSTENVNKH